MADIRIKVRHVKTKRIGAVEKAITSKHCTVQFRRDGYYEVCPIDDLEPITDEEFRAKWR